MANWQPILDGDLADTARGAADDLVASLIWSAPRRAEFIPPAPLPHQYAERALLCAYASTSIGAAANTQTLALLRGAADSLSSSVLQPWLHGGLFGVAWVFAHLSRRFDIDIGDDFFCELDREVSLLLDGESWERSYDLILGLVGIGVYLLERLPHLDAVANLNRLVRHLDRISTVQSSGIAWFSDPRWLPDIESRAVPRGYYAVGMAHGIAGVIAFLTALMRSGRADNRARRLLLGAVAWLASCPKAENYSRFPTIVTPDFERRGTFGWCWGDLGIVTALLSAAGAMNMTDWKRLAIGIAMDAARLSTIRVDDARLCHGSCGNAHVFNRLYQATGIPEFKSAAVQWFRTALSQRSVDRGICGFATWGVQEDGSNGWTDDPTVLNGAAGVALAFIAATSDEEPGWDRWMLLS